MPGSAPHARFRSLLLSGFRHCRRLFCPPLALPPDVAMPPCFPRRAAVSQGRRIEWRRQRWRTEGPPLARRPHPRGPAPAASSARPSTSSRSPRQPWLPPPPHRWRRPSSPFPSPLRGESRLGDRHGDAGQRHAAGEPPLQTPILLLRRWLLGQGTSHHGLPLLPADVALHHRPVMAGRADLDGPIQPP